MNIIYNNNSIKIIENNECSYIEFEVNENIEIKKIENKDSKILEQLINKLIILTYYYEKNIVCNNLDYTFLLEHHFEKNDNSYILEMNKIRIKRFVKIGNNKTGQRNNICDVNDVKVGHFTVDSRKDNDAFGYNTGVTVISPHSGNIFREKVCASSYAFNGFGKSMGLVQIEELGTIETNIVFTSTLNIGKISDAVITDALNKNIEIGKTTGTVNPIVMECNDGELNNSRERILGRNSYYQALADLKDDFKQGDIGAGCGMICHGFKGGIGSSSRVITIDGKEYTIGIILNSNFGSSNGKDLIFKGHHLGEKIKAYLEESEDKGSIVACFATDIPLNERQIKRVLKRVEIGIGRTGSYAGNGSGDVFVGFSTANKISHFPNNAIRQITNLSDNYINEIFKRTVEMTEEAVLNSLLFSHHLKGYQKEVKCLNEVNQLFYDLIDEEIEYEI